MAIFRKISSLRFGIACVFALVICTHFACSTKKYTTANVPFKLKYNALHDIDELLSNAEDALFREEIVLKDFSLFGLPNPIFDDQFTAAIQTLQDLMVGVADDKIREQLYFRIGLAYYLKSDFYNSIAYFDLLSNIKSNQKAFLWKMNALRALGKTDDSIAEINEVDLSTLSEKNLVNLYALKSDIFRQNGILDSAVFYLDKAFKLGIPSEYKFYWQLAYGKLLSIKDTIQAKTELEKVAKSNTAPNLLKLKAKIELISLQHKQIDDKSFALRKILKNGYSIGLEWLVNAELAKLYRTENIADSVRSLSAKVIDHQSVPADFKNLERWKFVQYLLQQNNIDEAADVLEQIDLTALGLLDKKSQVLVSKQVDWISLLQNVAKQKSDNSLSEYVEALYNLANFYRKNQIDDEAIQVLRQLIILNPAKQNDYLHDLKLLGR